MENQNRAIYFIKTATNQPEIFRRRFLHTFPWLGIISQPIIIHYPLRFRRCRRTRTLCLLWGVWWQFEGEWPRHLDRDVFFSGKLWRKSETFCNVVRFSFSSELAILLLLSLACCYMEQSGVLWAVPRPRHGAISPDYPSQSSQRMIYWHSRMKTQALSIYCKMWSVSSLHLSTRVSRSVHLSTLCRPGQVLVRRVKSSILQNALILIIAGCSRKY